MGDSLQGQSWTLKKAEKGGQKGGVTWTVRKQCGQQDQKQRKALKLGGLGGQGCPFPESRQESEQVRIKVQWGEEITSDLIQPAEENEGNLLRPCLKTLAEKRRGKTSD